MTADNKTTTQQGGKAPSAKRPFMLAYTVKPIDEGRNSVWSKVGAAWAHKDGQGYEIRMDAVPVDGRIVLRTVKDAEDQQTGEVMERSPE